MSYMVEYILSNILLQLVYFVGILFIVGFAISLLNRLFYILAEHSSTVCYATGLIGTPIHELSHAIMCLVFFHKITDMKLFQIDKQSGTLGYVCHAYNPKNWYQVMGNYFIGAAPIFGGTILIYFAIKWIMPETALEIENYFEDLSFLQMQGLSMNWFRYAGIVVLGMLEMLLASVSTDITWWIFAVLVLSIALHMNLSGADIRGAVKAIPILIAVIVIFNFAFGMIWAKPYVTVTGYINLAGSYLSGILLLSLVLSLICVGVAAAIRFSGMGIGKLIKR